MNTGKINIIAGPMYTGKTNYIVSKLIQLRNNRNNSYNDYKPFI